MKELFVRNLKALKAKENCRKRIKQTPAPSSRVSLCLNHYLEGNPTPSKESIRKTISIHAQIGHSLQLPVWNN